MDDKYVKSKLQRMALELLVGLCVQILQNGEREDTLVSSCVPVSTFNEAAPPPQWNNEAQLSFNSTENFLK